jgi:hypothetical protein
MIAFYVLKWMGVAGIFFAVGRRMGRSFGREMSLLGATLLTFGIYVLITMAPTPLGIVGLLFAGVARLVFFIVVEAPAVGMMMLTRLGTRRRDDMSQPPPPAPRSFDEVGPAESEILRDPRSPESPPAE